MRDRGWLIWNNMRGAWWKANRHGYTLDLGEAGRFTHDEAKKVVAESDPDPDGFPGTVMMREPTGRVPAPAYTEIVAAARVVGEGHRQWTWEHNDWPALTYLIALVGGHRWPRPLPSCGACGHSEPHGASDGCVAWVPASASVIQPVGHPCACKARDDLTYAPAPVGD